jgi:hypothetical protein
MKYFKIILLTISTLFIFINFSQAATFNVCSNEPVPLSWSSLGCTSNFLYGSDNPNCSFSAQMNNPGSTNVTLASGSCTVNISCTNAAGPASDSATLIVDSTKVWNGTSCIPAVAPPTPTGNISASACVIAANATGCNTSVSWSTSNLTAAATAVTYPNSQVLSSSPNSAGVTNTINGISSRTFTLYHGGVLLNSVTVTSACDTGSTWTGGKCTPTPCANGALNPPTCTVFTACANGALNPPTCTYPVCLNGLPASYQPSCACPINQAIVSGVCANVGLPTISAVWSGNANPLITTTCPSPLTQTSLTRYGVTVNLVGGYDTSVVSGINADTHNYTVKCNGSGVNSGLEKVATASITLPANVKINNLQNVTSPIGLPITTTWTSGGDQCTVHDNSNALIKSATRSGTAPNYNYSITLNPSAPDYRTELNTKRIDANKLTYKIKCTDTTQPIRGTGNNNFTAEIFEKPIATISGPNATGQLTLTCTPDYNKVDIQIDGASLSGYPKNYGVPPALPATSNFSAMIPYDANKSYIITCSYNTYAAQAAKSKGLQIFGSIHGVSGVADGEAVANSTSGLVSNMTYTIENSDSWAIEVRTNSDGTGPAALSGTNVSPASLGRYTPDSFGKVSIINNTFVYSTGLNVKIMATKSGVTKTLVLKLVKDNGTTAKLTVISAADPIDLDKVKLTLKCDNAVSYILYKNGIFIPAMSGLTGGNNFVANFDDTAVPAVIGGSVTNYKLDCDTASAVVAFSMPTRTPVKISTFAVQPNQIACPGGNDSANLKFTMSNTVGKVCRINSAPISNTLNRDEKAIQMSALGLQLGGTQYKSTNSESAGYSKSFASVMADRNSSGVSAGQLIMSSPTVLSSGKRLLNYSTRFTVECDSVTAPGGSYSNPSAVTYSKKSVDMLSACVGQD